MKLVYTVITCIKGITLICGCLDLEAVSFTKLQALRSSGVHSTYSFLCVEQLYTLQIAFLDALLRIHVIGEVKGR